ncbi:hypothetical protein KY340_01620 [Candidatus Woesearchaeota archaeon]|nr:hypothetical protein [Candidatus Woesearchaeota archaeon]
MNGILLAFLITLIGCINLDFYKFGRGEYFSWLKGQINNLKWGAPIALIIAYVYMPAILFPDIITPIGILLAINCFITIVRPIKLQKIIVVDEKKKVDLARFKVPIAVLVILLIILVSAPIVPLFQTKTLHELPNAIVSNEKINQIDTSHIRQVPIEFAYWMADKVVGDLGYKVQVGDLNIQLVSDRLYWIAPLELGNFWKWLRFRTSPGFLMVDAEDPEAKVERIDNLELKYMSSAFFQQNVYRHVYQRYPFVRLSEFTFEIDDENNPKWVVSVTKPTVWFTGEQVLGVIIVDPVTGEMEFPQKIPKWVDRVVPERLAEKYNYWYGAYTNGFWNTKFSQKDMHVPTTSNGVIDVFAVRGPEGMYWFTGHTSPSLADKSLMGYSMMNTQTGEFVYYSNVNGYYNEDAAVSNANSKVSNFQGYWGAQPIFYNLFGELTWVVPILSSNSKLQRIALVHAETGYVVVEEKLEDSLAKYKEWLEEKGVSVEAEGMADEGYQTVDGKVKRINGDLIVLENNDEHIFKINLENNEAKITKEGDEVRIKYIESDKTIINVKEFDNLVFDFE